MLPQNKAMFDALGITKWHEAGYTGKRGLSITYENPTCNHGYETASVFHEVAPDRQLVQVNDGTGLTESVVKWMCENKPDTGFRSLDIDTTGQDALYASTLPFCSLFNSADNQGEMSYSKAIEDEVWFGVGAVGYVYGEYVPFNYSSESPYVDFCGVTDVYIAYPSGVISPFPGTSCSAPMLAGMCALVNDFFIEQIGRSLSHYEMYRFVLAHCLDIKTPGKDNKTGYGVFILPDPAQIKVLKLTLGSKAYTVNGEAKEMDATPFAVENRTYVPIRFVAEALGCLVNWNAENTNEVVIIK